MSGVDCGTGLGWRGGPGARSHRALSARDESSGFVSVKGATGELRTGQRHDLSSGHSGCCRESGQSVGKWKLGHMAALAKSMSRAPR